MLKSMLGAACALAVTATAAHADVVLVGQPPGETWTYEITGFTGEISGLSARSEYAWGWNVPEDFSNPVDWLTFWDYGVLAASTGMNQQFTNFARGGSLTVALGVDPLASVVRARISNRVPESYDHCGTGQYGDCALVFQPLKVTLFYIDKANVVVTSMSAVPEPGTWAMMITGFGLAGTLLRRRKGERAAASAS